jgi:probable addiction module antidote protein
MKAVNQKVARRLGIRQFDAAALADGDPGVLAAALGNIAKARGMTQLARKTGIAREALYRTLSANGNPELATLTKVLKGLGLRLSIAADDQRAVA